MAPQKNIDYQHIFDEFPSAIVILDKLGKILNVNNRLFEWLGYKPEDVIGKRITNLPYIPKQARKIVLKNFALRVLGKHVPPYDLEFTHKDGTPKVGRISAKFTKDPKTGTYIDIVHIENISKEDRFKRALETQKTKTQELFATLAQVALELSKEQPLNEKLQNAIAIVGTALNFDRVYIFEDSEDNSKTSNTYEWVAEGISSEKANLQDINYENDIPGFQDLIAKDGIINAPKVNQLPTSIKKVLEAQQIKSVLIIPLKTIEKTIGFIGFDAVQEERTWKKEEIHLLQILSELTTQTFERELTKSLLNEKIQDLSTMNKVMVGRELRMAELKKKLDQHEEE
jgi:PAS domain S-box-containing protein